MTQARTALSLQRATRANNRTRPKLNCRIGIASWKVGPVFRRHVVDRIPFWRMTRHSEKVDAKHPERHQARVGLCLPAPVNERIGENALNETQGTLRWSDRYLGYGVGRRKMRVPPS
jgi:hypothetical protein